MYTNEVRTRLDPLFTLTELMSHTGKESLRRLRIVFGRVGRHNLTIRVLYDHPDPVWELFPPHEREQWSVSSDNCCTLV